MGLLRPWSSERNLILKATELGLSTLIMGLRDGDKIRDMLSIPESETIVSVIAVGKPMRSPAVRDAESWRMY